MTIAVLTFDFDPVVRVGSDASVRLETLAVAAVLFLGLVLVAIAARRMPRSGLTQPALRSDDLLFIAIGAVPGALLGGRVGYVLDHLPYYRANPAAITDLSQGALSLSLAVPLALLAGGTIARLIGAPVARWMHAIALPLLAVLATAKLAGVLGATGQGLPADLPWATAYVGPGPWGSLAADVPSQPSQVYEAILVGGAAAALAGASRFRRLARPDGAALFVALGLWAAARFVVAFTWRDPSVVGPLRIDQLLSLLLVVLAVLGVLERSRAPLMAEGWSGRELEPEPSE